MPLICKLQRLNAASHQFSTVSMHEHFKLTQGASLKSEIFSTIKCLQALTLLQILQKVSIPWPQRSQTKMDLITVSRKAPSLLDACTHDDISTLRVLRLVSKELSVLALLSLKTYSLTLESYGGCRAVCVANVLRPTQLHHLCLNLLLSSEFYLYIDINLSSTTIISRRKMHVL